jgi:DNA-binding response OmpR family regulator
MIDGSRILLVEDDDLLAREIVRALERDNWPIDHVGSLGEAFEAIIQFPYRAILLDRRLPDGDGIGLIPAAKSRASPPSIIFLTARDDLAARVEGLDAGADDYLVKPFAPEELLARLRAACRRPGPTSKPAPIEVGRLSYDPGSREVLVGGRPIVVPRRELALLELLVDRASRVVQRGHLESELYGLNVEVTTNALDALVSRLRRRLEEEDAGVELRLVRGVGYILQAC